MISENGQKELFFNRSFKHRLNHIALVFSHFGRYQWQRLPSETIVNITQYMKVRRFLFTSWSNLVGSEGRDC